MYLEKSSFFALATMAAFGCDKGSDSADAEADADTDTDTDSDTDSDSDSDSDTDSDSDGDTDSDTDTDTDPGKCGDGTVDVGEDCDSNAVDAVDCDFDCTFAECGDAYVNTASGETCEPTTGEVWERCGPKCVYGAGLDGTWGAKWESLAGCPRSRPTWLRYRASTTRANPTSTTLPRESATASPRTSGSTEAPIRCSGTRMGPAERPTARRSGCRGMASCRVRHRDADLVEGARGQDSRR